MLSTRASTTDRYDDFRLCFVHSLNKFFRQSRLARGCADDDELCLGLVLPLCRIACNPEFMHSQLKGGPLHAKMCRCTVGTCYNPIALFQSFKNLLTFRFFQNLAKSAICRFRRCRSFQGKAGLGRFKIANIHS